MCQYFAYKTLFPLLSSSSIFFFFLYRTRLPFTAHIDKTCGTEWRDASSSSSFYNNSFIGIIPKNFLYFLFPLFPHRPFSYHSSYFFILFRMSVDQTITELSGTLAQLSTLVAHINGQISGITGRVNLTLDNFDQAVANLAKDAGSLTYQVGNTVSQVSFYYDFPKNQILEPSEEK